MIGKLPNLSLTLRMSGGNNCVKLPKMSYELHSIKQEIIMSKSMRVEPPFSHAINSQWPL